MTKKGSILTYIESEKGIVKKSSLEVASYARALADNTNYSLIAVLFNTDEDSVLNDYGIEKIIKIDGVGEFNNEIYADSLKQVAEKENSKIIVLSNSANSKARAPPRPAVAGPSVRGARRKTQNDDIMCSEEEDTE